MAKPFDKLKNLKIKPKPLTVAGRVASNVQLLTIAKNALNQGKKIPGPLRNVIRGVEIGYKAVQTINRVAKNRSGLVKYIKPDIPAKFKQVIDRGTKFSLKPLPKQALARQVARSEYKERTSVNAAGKTKTISKWDLKKRNARIKKAGKDVGMVEENLATPKYQPKENRAGGGLPATKPHNQKFHDMALDKPPRINKENLQRIKDMIAPVAKKKTMKRYK